MSPLRPLREVCVPRADVLAGRLADNHFAAQLDKIVRDPGSYPVYGDPDRFFGLTYPTSGLKALISTVFGRLGGSDGAGGEHGVLRVETSFGGGKTHGLIAIHHLASGVRPANLDEFADPRSLPDGPVPVAAVVGDALDPVNGLTTNGHTTYTLWGEMAAQLGDDAVATLEASDRTRTAPGTETIRAALGGRRAIVIIDEIAQHFRQLGASGEEGVRRSAGQLPVFLKNLFEVAAGGRELVVIVTLASVNDAYGRETDELSALLDEMGGQYAATLGEAHSVVARVGRPIQPATDDEIGEILKRRLFEGIDGTAAREAGSAYRELYDAVGRAEALAGGAERPASYGELVERCYPFHPELIRVLDKRLGDIPNFQRARGALRLLAEIIADIYRRGDDAEILNVADIDYGQQDVLNHLTVGIGRPDFERVAAADLAGGRSHAALVDERRFSGRPPHATRVCRTVFTHSLEIKQDVGAGRTDYLLGTLRVDDDPAIIDEALAEAEKVCWHLSYNGTRWRFHTEPNVNKIVEDEKLNVANTVLTGEVDSLVETVFASDAGVKVIHRPTGPVSVPDSDDLRLVVVHHDQLAVTSSGAEPPHRMLVEMLDHAGASHGIRRYRNTLVFVTADAEKVNALKDRVRTRIAVEQLATDTARLAQFPDSIRARIVGLRDQSRLEARVAVTVCYGHVYYPSGPTMGHLAHIHMPAQARGDTTSAARAVLQVLADEGKIRSTRIAYSWLRNRTWVNKDAVTTLEIADWFTRDHAAPILRDLSLLREAVRDGILHDGWVYNDLASGKIYAGRGAAPEVAISRDAEVMTHEAAGQRGLLVKEPTLADLRAVMTEPSLSATEIRARLESRCGGEPTKGKVGELLATAVGNERYEYLVVVDEEPGEGVNALTPTQIRVQGLGRLIAVTRAEADAAGVGIPGRIAQVRIEASGATGIVLRQLSDQISDLGKKVTQLKVTTEANDAVGSQDMNLLVAALGQLPRHHPRVSTDLVAEFPASSKRGEGMNLRVSDARSADFQELHGKLSGLLGYASTVVGTLSLTIDFDTPVSVDDTEWTQVVDVLKGLAPSHLIARAEPAE